MAYSTAGRNSSISDRTWKLQGWGLVVMALGFAFFLVFGLLAD